MTKRSARLFSYGRLSARVSVTLSDTDLAEGTFINKALLALLI
nr:MAG TPA: hypothetical protein [Caudoviricetes sp.]